MTVKNDGDPSLCEECGNHHAHEYRWKFIVAGRTVIVGWVRSPKDPSRGHTRVEFGPSVRSPDGFALVGQDLLTQQEVMTMLIPDLTTIVENDMTHDEIITQGLQARTNPLGMPTMHVGEA